MQIGDRPVLCLASSHEADEKIVLNALGSIPENMLIVLVPRKIERSRLIRRTIEDMGVSVSVGDQYIDSNIRVHLVDKFGELGIWYRMCSIAFIGGTFDETQGHNPWEAIHLNRPVLHGPNINNFKLDYAQLDTVGLSHLIFNSDGLANYLELTCHKTSAQQESESFNPLVTDLDNLATDLLALMDGDRVDNFRSSAKVMIFLVFYRFIWFLCMPFVLCFLVYRSKHEPAYAEKLLERFGIGQTRNGSWVWIHAVSLGEFRSAIPLVDKLLERGERVIITHFTPAGRAASEKYYADHISSGCVLVHWVPFDYRLAFKRFFRSFQD